MRIPITPEELAKRQAPATVRRLPLLSCPHNTVKRHQCAAQTAPQERIGQTHLALPVHRCAPVIPYLPAPVPDKSACKFNRRNADPAKRGLCCRPYSGFTQPADQQRCAAACHRHGVVRPLPVKKLQQRITRRTKQKCSRHAYHLRNSMRRVSRCYEAAEWSAACHPKNDMPQMSKKRSLFWKCLYENLKNYVIMTMYALGRPMAQSLTLPVWRRQD